MAVVVSEGYIKKSLPSRERGLKPFCLNLKLTMVVSLPSRERGLKLNLMENSKRSFPSLPSRERGLKPCAGQLVVNERRRSPRGSVD